MSAPLTKHDATDEVISMPGVGITLAAGNTVPSDTAAGYAKSCVYQHLDSSTAATTLYVNTGTVSSCTFRPLTPAAQGAALTAQLTSLTIADAAGTPDYALQAVINTNAYGFASAQEAISFLYVVQNLQVRMAEVEARLEAMGAVAAN